MNFQVECQILSMYVRVFSFVKQAYYINHFSNTYILVSTSQFKDNLLNIRMQTVLGKKYYEDF